MNTAIPELTFAGTVRSNKGLFHQEMVVPGRDALSAAPDDWPSQLAPGTLNIAINSDGFPLEFDQIGTGDRVKRFDAGTFVPAFVIGQREIAGNTLKPSASLPNRGTAQVWRAELTNLSTGEATKCWMLRRIGSTIASQIELVAAVHLRRELKLSDGTPVRLVIFSG